MTNRAVVGAWVGSPNLGDELIFSILLRLLKELGIEASATSVNPAETNTRFGIVSFDHLNPFELKKHLAKSDAFIFGGGGLIQNETGIWNLPYHLYRVRAARKQNLPWIGIGLGASGVSGQKALNKVKNAFKDHLGISVRDEQSAQILESIGIPRVTRSADLAWLTNRTEGIRPTKFAGILGVSLRNPQSSKWLPAAIGPRSSAPDETVSLFAKQIDAASIATGMTVRFITMNSKEDKDLHEKVSHEMTVQNEVVEADLENLGETFEGLEAVLTMRYHAGVIGALNGAAVVCLPFSQKLYSLADDLGPAASKAFNIEEIVSCLEKVLTTRSQLSEGVEFLRLKAFKNVEVLGLLGEMK